MNNLYAQNKTNKNFKSINKTRAFEKIDKKVTEAIGAPPYTEAAQKWKGAAVNLNNKLYIIKIIANTVTTEYSYVNAIITSKLLV